LEEKNKIKILEARVLALEKTRDILMDKIEFYQTSVGKEFNSIQSSFFLSRKAIETQADKERLTEVLALQSYKMGQIFRSLPGAVLITTNEGKLREAYPGVEFPFVDFSKGDELIDVFCGNFENDYFRAIRSPEFKEKGMLFYQAQCVQKDKEYFLQVGVSKLQGDELVLSVRDITQEVVLKKAMQEQEAQMIHTTNLASFEGMASSAAHEINNPLTVLIFRTQHLKSLILSGTYTSKELTDSLSLIKKMAERISKISVSMRRLSRDSRDESKSKVFITHVLEDVQSVSSHKFYQISVDLRIDISDILHEKEVMVYPVQLSQVIINLLNNAFDAVEKVDDKFVEIQVSVKNKKNLEIRVKDSGKGIPEKLKAKIFDPFFTTKSADRGTGIGLGLCKTIVTKHEGHFYLDEQAENTCFVIEIPDAVVG